MATRRKFDKEFKLEAVRLATGPGTSISETAERLGVLFSDRRLLTRRVRGAIASACILTPRLQKRGKISFYHYDSICSALECSLDAFLAARNGLIDKDLIAFDGSRFQVLSLPERPRSRSSPPLRTRDDLELHDPATIQRLVDDKPR
jgi:transposase-like protein